MDRGEAESAAPDVVGQLPDEYTPTAGEFLADTFATCRELLGGVTGWMRANVEYVGGLLGLGLYAVLFGYPGDLGIYLVFFASAVTVSAVYAYLHTRPD